MKNALKRFWWITLLLILIIAGAGFYAWVSDSAAPSPEAADGMKTSAQVMVRTSPWLSFFPAHREPVIGLILYPGDRVDYRAYAPVAKAIAAQGYLVVIVDMPLNLAVLDSNKADEVIANFPQIRYWAIGGHSLGGSMAAHYALKNPDKIHGLVLWAAYPSLFDDLSEQEIKAVSIVGTSDGLTTVKKVESSKSRMPATTRWVAIQGGNHAQFGWYGDQAGDNPASISQEEQQSQIVLATVALLRELGFIAT